MLTYRTFRNTDPPTLASIWQSRAGQPALAQPISVGRARTVRLCEALFRLPRTDPGLRGRARRSGSPTPASAPAKTRTRVSTELGTTCLVLARPDCPQGRRGRGAAGAERGLSCAGSGAKVLYGGGIRPLNAFYFGLYGGSEMPGVLETDRLAQQAYFAAGLRGDRPHAALAAGLDRLRGDRGPPPDANPPPDGGRGGHRSAVADVVGGLRPGRVRSDPLRAGAARRRPDGGLRHLPQHGVDAQSPAPAARSA